jgi:prevent-host-death family protein
MKTIAQRELRNKSGEILRKAERGQEFVITVGGRPTALLGPYRGKQWVSKTEVVRILERGAADPSFFDDIADMPGAALDADDREQA